MAIPDSVREVVASARLAHFVTLNSDGSPQVTCVWVAIEGDEIVMAHLAEYQKVKNVRKDGRVALSIETDKVNAQGLNEYLVVYGDASVQDGGAPELLQSEAFVYIGPGVKFPPMPDPPPGFVIRVRPRRYSGVGSWVGEPAG
jgi:PPOX class probable F420-dependent enzyme